VATEGTIDLVLVAPQIAGNTGNVVRMCANTGARLHLVEPLGFSLEDKLLRRAGLDYHDLATVERHPDWASVTGRFAGRRMVAFSSRGTRRYTDAALREAPVLVFGREEDGLSTDVLGTFAPDDVLRLPMRPNNRSLNLANACAVVVYETWRQMGFPGAV
jgi:tRNA (cytidine/uridine-2'-O-)-methyltransferase